MASRLHDVPSSFFLVRVLSASCVRDDVDNCLEVRSQSMYSVRTPHVRVHRSRHSMHMTRDPQYSEYEATPLHMIIRCASARMCGRPAQVSSASERPKGGAADHGEPPHGMHPHRVSASLWRKKKAASSQRQTTASGASNRERRADHRHWVLQQVRRSGAGVASVCFH